MSRAGLRSSVLPLFGALLGVILYCAPPAGAASAPTFTFSTGSPDGKMAMASRPASSGKPEIEAGDDFVLTATTAITHATFTGLMPASGSVQDVLLEIYRVFPLDSNTTRTITVPTRVNSPSDVDFQSRDANMHQVRVTTSVLSSSFTAANSVLNGIHPAPNQTTGGEGPVTGQEVLFSATLTNPFVLPAGHYFFIPQVQVSGPVTNNFYWLSSPKPIVAPGTPFTPDLQAWIRNSALQPDWLRVGTDIVGGATPPTFNATFTLNNAALTFAWTGQPIPGGVGVKLSVAVPSEGTLRAIDPLVGKGHKKAWFNAVTVNARRAGTVHIKLVPNATGNKQLALHHTIHLKAALVFTPTGGQPSTRTVPITWHRK